MYKVLNIPRITYYDLINRQHNKTKNDDSTLENIVFKYLILIEKALVLEELKIN